MLIPIYETRFEKEVQKAQRRSKDIKKTENNYSVTAL